MAWLGVTPGTAPRKECWAKSGVQIVGGDWLDWPGGRVVLTVVGGGGGSSGSDYQRERGGEVEGVGM